VPTSLIRESGEEGRPSKLSDFNTTKMRQLRVFAALLKDEGRIEPESNRVLADGSVVLSAFSGSIGADLKGEFKPGEVERPTIGAYESGVANPRIYESYQVQAPTDHPWQKLTLDDLREARGALATLTDFAIQEIVRDANYLNRDDARSMINLLQSRRDALQKELQGLIKNHAPRK
jgi:hypothetical protein